MSAEPAPLSGDIRFDEPPARAALTNGHAPGEDPPLPPEVTAEELIEAREDPSWRSLTPEERADHIRHAAGFRAGAERSAQAAGFASTDAYLAATVPGFVSDYGPRLVEDGWEEVFPRRGIDHIERLGAEPLSEISTDPPAPLLLNRLDPEGHTILYGTGGVGKGVIAAWWIAEMVRAGHRVLVVDYENHPSEWARRVVGLGGPDRLIDVLHVAPLTAAWGSVRGPMWVQAPDLRELAQDWQATYLVIDSIVPACAGFDPMKPEAAALYAGGLEYIGLPALSLAHVTKAEELTYPFGSAFWHHLARMTWSLKRDGERAILQHRKHNNYPALGRFVMTVSWHEDLPREVWEQGYSVALADAIAEVLEAEPDRTVAQLVAQLNEGLDEDREAVKADSVSKALRRGLGGLEPRFAVTGSGSSSTWRIA